MYTLIFYLFAYLLCIFFYDIVHFIFKDDKSDKYKHTKQTRHIMDKNHKDKKEKCLEYLKTLHIGFRECEYEMALQIGDIEMFENYSDYYSELEKEAYHKMATSQPIVYTQRLPFLGTIEIPTGKFTVPFYKNYNIKNHDVFNERVDKFFERRTKERRIFNKQNFSHKS